MLQSLGKDPGCLLVLLKGAPYTAKCTKACGQAGQEGGGVGLGELAIDINGLLGESERLLPLVQIGEE